MTVLDMQTHDLRHINATLQPRPARRAQPPITLKTRAAPMRWPWGWTGRWT